jgi:hypothetical protein
MKSYHPCTVDADKSAHAANEIVISQRQKHKGRNYQKPADSAEQMVSIRKPYK